jgi:hypothetical protein
MRHAPSLLLIALLAAGPAAAADVTLKDNTDGARTKAFTATAFLLGSCAGRLTPETQARAESMIAIGKLQLTAADEPQRASIATLLVDARKAGAESAAQHPEESTPAKCEEIFARQIARLQALP